MCTPEVHIQISTLLAVLDCYVSRIDEVDAVCDILGQTLKPISHSNYPVMDSSLQERLTTTISDFQETLDLIAKYDWDFDSYLEEDVPAAVSPCQFYLQLAITKYFKIRHTFSVSLWIYLWSTIFAIQGFMSWSFVEHLAVILQ